MASTNDENASEKQMAVTVRPGPTRLTEEEKKSRKRECNRRYMAKRRKRETPEARRQRLEDAKDRYCEMPMQQWQNLLDQQGNCRFRRYMKEIKQCEELPVHIRQAGPRRVGHRATNREMRLYSKRLNYHSRMGRKTEEEIEKIHEKRRDYKKGRWESLSEEQKNNFREKESKRKRQGIHPDHRNLIQSRRNQQHDFMNALNMGLLPSDSNSETDTGSYPAIFIVFKGEWLFQRE